MSSARVLHVETRGSAAPFDNVRPKRLLVVEEALKSEVGHFFEYDRAVVEAHKAIGCETVVAAHGSVAETVKAAIGARPVFAKSSWDRVYMHPSAARRLAGIFEHNWLVYRALRAFVAEHGSFDGVFLPTVALHHVMGAQLFAARELGRGTGRVMLLFRNSLGQYVDGVAQLDPIKRMMWRRTMARLLPEVRRGRVLLATDSDRLSAEYERLTGQTLTVLPHPNFVVRGTRTSAFRADDPFTFGCLGPPRLEKGIDLVLHAIRLFRSRHPKADARFVLQWNEEVRESSGALVEPGQDITSDPGVRFIRRPLSSADYEAELGGLDCMLLPYRRTSYAARISGVAVEAVTSGMPVIYTSDTWTADLVSRHGAGIAVRDEDAENLAEAIGQMYERRSEFTGEARQRAAGAQKAHAPETFVARLWGAG